MTCLRKIETMNAWSTITGSFAKRYWRFVSGYTRSLNTGTSFSSGTRNTSGLRQSLIAVLGVLAMLSAQPDLDRGHPIKCDQRGWCQ